jgi:2'-5' RNA ligase
MIYTEVLNPNYSPQPDPMIRAFLAIEFGTEPQQALRARVMRLKMKEPGKFVRWTRLENLHLTLRFLGNQPKSVLERILSLLEQPLGEIEPFSVGLMGLGVFPSIRKPRVIWIGVSAPPALAHAALIIQKCCLEAGVGADEKPFSPHITLGRVGERADPARVREWLEGVMAEQAEKDNEASPAQVVKSVTMVKSVLTPAGPVYTPLGLVKLSELSEKRKLD